MTAENRPCSVYRSKTPILNDPVKAAPRASVAGGTFGLAFQPNCILITVNAGFKDVQHVAAGFPFYPKRLTAARPEGRPFRLQSQAKSFRVHVGQHQHLARGRICADRRQKTLLIEMGGKVSLIRHKLAP